MNKMDKRKIRLLKLKKHSQALQITNKKKMKNARRLKQVLGTLSNDSISSLSRNL